MPKLFEKGGPGGPGRPKGSGAAARMRALIDRELAKRHGKTSLSKAERIAKLVVLKATEGEEPYLSHVLDRIYPKTSKVQLYDGPELERPSEVPTTEERLAELARIHQEQGDGVLH